MKINETRIGLEYNEFVHIKHSNSKHDTMKMSGSGEY